MKRHILTWNRNAQYIAFARQSNAFFIEWYFQQNRFNNPIKSLNAMKFQFQYLIIMNSTSSDWRFVQLNIGYSTNHSIFGRQSISRNASINNSNDTSVNFLTCYHINFTAMQSTSWAIQRRIYLTNSSILKPLKCRCLCFGLPCNRTFVGKWGSTPIVWRLTDNHRLCSILYSYCPI